MPERRDSQRIGGNRLWQRRARAWRYCWTARADFSRRLRQPHQARRRRTETVPPARPAPATPGPTPASAAPARTAMTATPFSAAAMMARPANITGASASMATARQQGGKPAGQASDQRQAGGKDRQRPRRTAPAPAIISEAARQRQQEQGRDIGKSQQAAPTRQGGEQHGGEAQIEPRRGAQRRASAARRRRRRRTARRRQQRANRGQNSKAMPAQRSCAARHGCLSRP